MIARILGAPALHFLLVGGALLALRGAWDGRAPERVVVDLARLRGEWTRAHGAPPGAAAEARLVAEAAEDEILHREALALGLDRRDEAVRERLRRLGRFLGEDARDEAALEREARALGLERTDVVVRRHLVQMMRLAAGRLGPADLPADADLEAYLDQHAADFAEPPRVRFTHVYLARDRRGPALDADAERLLAELRRSGAGPESAAAWGDPFLRGPTIGPSSRAELARVFGPDFARAVDDAPRDAWAGPFRSSYGLHLVWIAERTPGGMPALASVRGRVLHRWLEARSREQAASRLQALRARYQVDVAQ